MTTDCTEDSMATGPTPPDGDANPLSATGPTAFTGTADDAPSGVRRRSFLHRALAAGAAGAAVGAGGVGAVARAGDEPVPERPEGRTIPFHGAHQAGILTPVQRHAVFTSFDVTARDRAGLTDLLRTLTERLRFLTAGGVPEPLGISAPLPDSGVLGPVVPGDGLTATVAVGSSLFDDRFGLASLRPRRLRPMDVFPDDDPADAWCHGDLMLQLCADHPDTVAHALRDVARHTRGPAQIRWRMEGFVSPPRPSGTPRNLMGFKDGTGNPDTGDARLMDRLVWVRPGGGEPAWAAGGSYQVVRLIRMMVEFWDRVSLHEQERMMGRSRDSGAPLDGGHEKDAPRYAQDPQGDVIPLDAHIRLANPRTAATADTRLLRRGYNYDRGVRDNGDLDTGLVFCCFQQDLDRQFAAVQKKLAGEPLVDYVKPYGGGYFFALPGIRDRADWLGSALLA
ncbi:iron uptake transporter deferrochelatase/peroxidase subunit [Streptomyces sp. NBC_01317]|uniref:iron uptake transporter deferrochelatase/peroxidase subunit n=1 Tax=Streptomyces sp. NBC_01317 TaxID=2903822 RepID=UPI002E0E80A8|nr:iron uptake transporter deferrochelatase/peroxidase subunit [Streptomyces sp. NBC_01317]